ncbi:PAN2-PAN3 deadenylation complex subunit PAN3 isoform X1 [Drosophila eugracilis]|uniref:PAN2-PAN3 deadenylation complex subunit PAN3 isoform X1 n=2 Tax=Drosophila eugracilis TaxID=29029 RepID=UPI0007E6AE42|nr:PAN2-PAN3 deadenylation complex subunit PAN3 isoform X1 [Drosophila eugracilis]XP_017071183.1 PAN2-PAN3 deadenylation complex subunit PAN3 isoform X1 [Drosophila eugracilis]
MSTFLNNFFPADTAAMDPIFFSPTNGIPSESKLATYMNRQNVATTSGYGLNNGFSLLNLDSPLNKKSQVTPQSPPEFIPTRISSTPNFYAPYHNAPMQLSNGLNGVNGLTSAAVAAAAVAPSPTSSVSSASVNINKTVNGGGSMLTLQKSASIATVTIAQQQQHPQKQHPPPVGGGGISNASAPIAISGAPPNPAAAPFVSSMSAQTPLKGRGAMLRQESPTAAMLSGGGPGEKSPPHGMTPHGASPIPTSLPTSVHQENVGGTIYFYPTANAQNNQPVVNSVVVDTTHPAHHGVSAVAPMNAGVPPTIMYTGHVYPGPSSNVVTLQPKTLLESAFFMPDEMRSEILARNEISNLIMDAVEAAQHALPMEVDNYHALYPLEPPAQPMHAKLTLPASTYRATHNTTGYKYCLRRLHGFRLQSTKCMTLVDMWKKLQHTNVVQLREVFTTKAFGDNSLVLVYDYYPGSQTLLAKYFTPTPETNGYTDPFQGEARPFSHKSNMQRTSNGPLLPEATIWSIIMQLTAGLKAIHHAGLACKVLDPTKIIVTGKRVRFSSCCIADITQFDPNAANPLALVNMHQQDDLTALGRLVLALACRCLQSVQRDNVQSSIDMVTRNYSTDLRNFIVYLFTTNNRRSVTDLMPMIGARFYTQLDALQSQIDMQEDELAKEMENGRLYRILVKLNCINERSDLNLDCTWSETGDRYMLKLFRDFLFHSVTEDGRPWLDHAHIVQCLNKLDAGCIERVQLMSRDEQSVLIVSYAELKNCLENAFSELMSSAAN